MRNGTGSVSSPVSGTVRASSSLARRSRLPSLPARLRHRRQQLRRGADRPRSQASKKTTGGSAAPPWSAVAQRAEDEGFGPSAAGAGAGLPQVAALRPVGGAMPRSRRCPFSLILTTCRTTCWRGRSRLRARIRSSSATTCAATSATTPSSSSSPQARWSMPVRRAQEPAPARSERERSARLPGRHRRRATPLPNSLIRALKRVGQSFCSSASASGTGTCACC